MLRARAGALALLLALGGSIAPATVQAQPATSALVLYDNEGAFGWLGELYATHLESLLSHFEIPVTRKPFADYQAGDIEDYDATFYIGAVYKDTALPTAFRQELDATDKTFVWIGQNLWRYALNMGTWAPRAAFQNKYGLKFLELSYDNHPTVKYKDQFLVKDPFDQPLNRLEITDPAKVTVFGECYDSGGNPWPYIMRSGNFWVVPDMPMINTGFRSRSLVFHDMLYDMLGVSTPERHRAVLRIEDVTPSVPVETLRGLRDVLAELNIPFTISLVPEYRDYFGTYNGGEPRFLALEPGTPFAQAIQELVDIGGQVIQHGTTHQIDGELNPYDGVSGTDYEFYLMDIDADGNLIYVGPVPGQDANEVRRRVLSGHDRIKKAGFAPVGWLTPHYLGSEIAYEQFARLYPFALDRAIFFTEDNDGKTQFLELNSPYIYRDTHGIKRIPETIGYIDPQGFAPVGVQLQAPSFPPTLIDRARALKVVRNSWAGCYFHWYLNPAYLKDLVRGVQDLGFEFVPITGDLK
jgi:uncharacterized protein YdaL